MKEKMVAAQKIDYPSKNTETYEYNAEKLTISNENLSKMNDMNDDDISVKELSTVSIR